MTWTRSQPWVRSDPWVEHDGTSEPGGPRDITVAAAAPSRDWAGVDIIDRPTATTTTRRWSSP